MPLCLCNRVNLISVAIFFFAVRNSSKLNLHIRKMGALIAKKLINWQALQERLDLQAVYRLTCMYGGRQPQQCSYEKQYLEVHCSITKQVIDK